MQRHAIAQVAGRREPKGARAPAMAGLPSLMGGHARATPRLRCADARSKARQVGRGPPTRCAGGAATKPKEEAESKPPWAEGGGRGWGAARTTLASAEGRRVAAQSSLDMSSSSTGMRSGRRLAARPSTCWRMASPSIVRPPGRSPTSAVSAPAEGLRERALGVELPTASGRGSPGFARVREWQSPLRWGWGERLLWLRPPRWFLPPGQPGSEARRGRAEGSCRVPA